MATPTQLVGQILGHYRVLEQIGAGGMGVVYRAHDERLDRDVALKVLPPHVLADEATRKRFRKEALALSRLNHPNIETVYDFDSEGGVDFLVMEYLPGVSLDEKLAAGFLPEKETIRLGSQLAEGLAAAHERGVVHRDLKPANLRLTAGGRLKILDFGLAKLLHPVSETAPTDSLSETQAGAGTLPYMAPEQLLGDRVDSRADIYALGAVLYEMATGRRPFPETQKSRLIDAILHEAPVAPRAINPHVSPALENIILKCLEKEPENRYQSVNELTVDLRRLTSTASSATAAASLPTGWRPSAGAWLAIVLLAGIGAAFWAFRGWQTKQTARVHIKSVAVLPLENLSGDPAQDYFADGMTEELINRLARMEETRVISRTSIMQYKGVHKPLREIARELGIDAVVEGSVARAGDRVRISADLVVAASEQRLWGDSYTRELREVLEMQDEVAEAIARQIRGKLLTRRATPAAGRREIGPGVYEEYLWGRYEWNKRTAEGTSAALEHFRQAIAKDAGYAPAYSGVADCYVTLWLSLGALSREQALPQAREVLQRALLLDPDLPDAHSTLGTIRMYADWDWSGAEAEFKRAIALNPSYATAHHWYGLHLAFRGQTREARQELERARELDPLSPIIQLNLAWVQFVAGDNDALIAASQKELASDSSFWDAHWDLGTAYVQQGELKKGIVELEKAVELSHNSAATLSSLGYALGRADQRPEAEQVLHKLHQRAQHEPVAADEIAMVYIGLGDNNDALLWLEQAYRAHSKGLVLLKADPWYRSLAGEPRYQELLRKIGLSSG
jgi:TolB-like protein/Flp pilus assembly protein TadD/predicted Ser/Thr protein kinase